MESNILLTLMWKVTLKDKRKLREENVKIKGDGVGKNGYRKDIELILYHGAGVSLRHDLSNYRKYFALSAFDYVIIYSVWITQYYFFLKKNRVQNHHIIINIPTMWYSKPIIYSNYQIQLTALSWPITYTNKIFMKRLFSFFFSLDNEIY